MDQRLRAICDLSVSVTREAAARRERARAAWNSGFSPRRRHKATLDLGAPPLGLLDHALR